MALAAERKRMAFGEDSSRASRKLKARNRREKAPALAERITKELQIWVTRMGW